MESASKERNWIAYPDIRSGATDAAGVAANCGLPEGERQSARDRLVILAGLRKMHCNLVEEEVRQVPILNGILVHEILGREYRKSQERRQDGELMILSRQIEKRYGSVPNWAQGWLVRLSAKEIEELSVCLLEAKQLQDSEHTSVRRDLCPGRGHNIVCAAQEARCI
jgi:hypothetical protein